MAIFRTRALDAANKTSAVDTPLLLPRPHHKRLRGNWQQLKDILLPNRTGRISATQEQRQNAPTNAVPCALRSFWVTTAATFR